MASPRTVFDTHVSRRSHKRVYADFSVVVISNHSGATRIATARSFDVSEGGIRVATSTPLQEQQAVSVEMKLPFKPVPLKMEAVVRHQRENCYGLEFLRASDAQARVIRDLVA